jgi:repressor LexA
MQRYFRVTAPVVHEMVKSLHWLSFITREPGKPRTIRLTFFPEDLPDLE